MKIADAFQQMTLRSTLDAFRRTILITARAVAFCVALLCASERLCAQDDGSFPMDLIEDQEDDALIGADEQPSFSRVGPSADATSVGSGSSSGGFGASGPSANSGGFSASGPSANSSANSSGSGASVSQLNPPSNPASSSGAVPNAQTVPTNPPANRPTNSVQGGQNAPSAQGQGAQGTQTSAKPASKNVAVVQLKPFFSPEKRQADVAGEDLTLSRVLYRIYSPYERGRRLRAYWDLAGRYAYFNLCSTNLQYVQLCVAKILNKYNRQLPQDVNLLASSALANAKQLRETARLDLLQGQYDFDAAFSTPAGRRAALNRAMNSPNKVSRNFGAQTAILYVPATFPATELYNTRYQENVAARRVMSAEATRLNALIPLLYETAQSRANQANSEKLLFEAAYGSDQTSEAELFNVSDRYFRAQKEAINALVRYNTTIARYSCATVPGFVEGDALLRTLNIRPSDVGATANQAPKQASPNQTQAPAQKPSANPAQAPSQNSPNRAPALSAAPLSVAPSSGLDAPNRSSVLPTSARAITDPNALKQVSYERAPAQEAPKPLAASESAPVDATAARLENAPNTSAETVETPKTEEVQPVEAPKTDEVQPVETPKTDEVQPVETPKTDETQSDAEEPSTFAHRASVPTVRTYATWDASKLNRGATMFAVGYGSSRYSSVAESQEEPVEVFEPFIVTGYEQVDNPPSWARPRAIPTPVSHPIDGTDGASWELESEFDAFFAEQLALIDARDFADSAFAEVGAITRAQAPQTTDGIASYETEKRNAEEAAKKPAFDYKRSQRVLELYFAKAALKTNQETGVSERHYSLSEVFARVYPSPGARFETAKAYWELQGAVASLRVEEILYGRYLASFNATRDEYVKTQALGAQARFTDAQARVRDCQLRLLGLTRASTVYGYPIPSTAPFCGEKYDLGSPAYFNAHMTRASGLIAERLKAAQTLSASLNDPQTTLNLDLQNAQSVQIACVAAEKNRELALAYIKQVVELNILIAEYVAYFPANVSNDAFVNALSGKDL